MEQMSAAPRRWKLLRLTSLLAAPCALLAVTIVLLFTSTGALAQASSLTIRTLNCDGTPETVELTNSGAEAVDVTGWTLQSDPASETFDLTTVGTVSAGSSVFISSGPGASGAFVWSAAEVFRDGDATDFARLLDADAVAVSAVNCAAATPAANEIPNGGGPPGGETGLAVGLVVAAAGGALVAVTILVGLIWMGIGLLTRSDRDKAAAENGEEGPESPSATPDAPPLAASDAGRLPLSETTVVHPQPQTQASAATAKASDVNLLPLVLVVLGAVLAALVLLLAISGGGRRK
jgi:hypothetical protein